MNADNSNPFNPSIYSIESEIQESLEGIKDKSEIISSELDDLDDLPGFGARILEVEEINDLTKGKIYKCFNNNPAVKNSATSSEIKPHLVGWIKKCFLTFN